MIGIDTNVLLRWLLRDIPEQAESADELMRSLTVEEPGFISIVTVVEIYSVMRRVLGLPLARVLDTIEQLLEMDELAFDDGETVWLAWVAAQAGADFPDALIAETNKLFGCEETVTFDRRAARHAGMTLLEPVS